MRSLAFLVLAAAAACSSAATTTGAPAAQATPEQDAAPDAASLTGRCADVFGSALTAGFGRIDGVVYAVQKPSDKQCTMPNSDHVVVQILMNGAVYRMVVNVSASAQDPTIRTAAKSHALPAPAFSEGWHAGAALDYAATLSAHASDLHAVPMNDAVAAIDAALHVGDPISVYATSGAGRPESAHLVHRNKASEDGAIVVNPTTKPAFLLFAFDNQTF